MSAAAIFTDGWFAYVRELCAGRTFGRADLTVELRCADDPPGSGDPGGDFTHWAQFADGRLVDWRPGATPRRPDLVVRQPLTAQLAMLCRTDLGEDLLLATELVDPVSGAVSAPPPLDEVRLGWGRDLPAMPTGDPFVVQSVYLGSPFGDIARHLRIEEGRVVDIGLGEASADLTFHRSYAASIRARMGTLDTLESLDGARIDGDRVKATIYLGLYESDAWTTARRALTTASCEPLLGLGAILACPEWAEVAAELQLATGDVWSVP